MKIKLWVMLGIVGFVLVACEFPEKTAPTSTPALQTYLWIDAPLDGSSIPLEPYKIVMHGSITNLHQYEISINGIVDGNALPLQNDPGNTNWITYGEYLWTPPAPGHYTISVMIVGASGDAANWSGTPAQARVWVMGAAADVASDDQPIPELPTATPARAAEDTPTVTATATATITAEPQACTLTALVNLFCRPAPGYEPIDGFMAGQTAPITAQSEELWQVIGPGNGARCTVPKDDTLVSVAGDCANVSSFNPLPPPTATFTPTPLPTATPTGPARQQPQCNDGIDNDGDGNIDLRDPECQNAGDNDESVP
jgi:hypothetical protein